MNDLQPLKDIPILDIASRLNIKVDRNNKAYCFKEHDKKTPSLSFNIKGNYFKCFGCNIGGSTIDLVKEYHNSTTGEAINWIKDQHGRQDTPHATGVFKTAFQEGNGRKDGRQYSDIYRFFIDMLDKTEALEYLKKRGFPDFPVEIVIDDFSIRTIPKDKAGDIKQSLINQYGIDKLKDCGLYAISGKTGKPYFTFFRHRLIFPYFDYDNKTILTLQGRNIDTPAEPKYKLLSGIKTAVYNLRDMQDTEHKTLYICEGAIDVLSCYILESGKQIGIAGASNKAIYAPEIFDRLGDYKIIIATDRDGTGKRFYKDFCRHYKEKYCRLPQVVNWDEIKSGKDINDLLKTRTCV